MLNLHKYSVLNAMPDSDEQGDPEEAVQGVEEDDKAAKPEAEIQQIDVPVTLSCTSRHPRHAVLRIKNY